MYFTYNCIWSWINWIESDLGP